MVEGSGLENRQAFTRLEGSNPSLSAKIPLDSPTPPRRGGRVAEGTGLLNLRRGNSTEGSNPSLSAIVLRGSGFASG